MSSPPLRVFSTAKDDKNLWQLTKRANIPNKVKEKMQVFRLSSRGWKVENIALYLKWSKATVWRTIHRWQEEGQIGLWEKSRLGAPKKWKKSDLKTLETLLSEEPRSYNTKQLCQILKQEIKIELSERNLQRILKKN